VFNRVILIGNLGADCELRHTQSGTSVCSFRMATTEKFKDRDGNAKETTEWHSCVLWGKRAEALSRYLSKGTRLAVEGSLTTRSWEDNGQKRYRTEIKVSDVKLLGGGGGGSSGRGGVSGGGAQQDDGDYGEEFDDDAITF